MNDLEHSYELMAQDVVREAEALEWAEFTLVDLFADSESPEDLE